MRHFFWLFFLPLFSFAQQQTPESSPAEWMNKNQELRKNAFQFPDKNIIMGDTLYITDDTLITGNWSFNGTLIAVDTGKILIQNATVLLAGDMIVFGNDARIDILNSTVNMPQQYFYQRSMIAAGSGIMNIENSTLNFNGLSHNMSIADNGSVIMNNVTTTGFRTCGLSGTGSININGINQAGEFVITGSSNVVIKNAETVLLWHQFPAGSIITHSFPDGDTLLSYDFNNTTPGVSGIDYNIEIDSCTDVMWGLMPEPNTNVAISNSTLRTIGLWFTGSDSLNVSGLVNQTTYANQLMNISDRSLTLQACSVRTWSIYTFDTVKVNVQSCIVGEIGTFGYSQLMTNTTMIDGSGGYFFAGDHSICLGGYTTCSSAVRSQQNGIMLYINSNVLYGALEALGESVLIVAQSTIPQDPAYRDQGCAWFVNIDGPYETYYGQNYSVNGSAWIDKDPSSLLMDFGSYQLFYSTDMGITWIAAGPEQVMEKRHEWLGYINTALFPSEGNYLIKATLKDNQTTPVAIDAIVALNVLPAYLSVSEQESNIRIYPNPATDVIYIDLLENSKCDIKLFSMDGKVVFDQRNISGDETHIDVSDLCPGLYLVEIAGKNIYRNKILVQ
ncbi:MAG TPA: hypothetical protein DHV29_10300 [Bacteroidales bacterium]|nr:hypothetical protein [Bacteroidales bacterium]HCY23866.1 hypothetical protein [Bacteroidales bacterium]